MELTLTDVKTITDRIAVQCEMSAECSQRVTHIGVKGYVYCAEHAAVRRGIERTRRMRAWEIRWIREGRVLPSYRPLPEPVSA